MAVGQEKNSAGRLKNGDKRRRLFQSLWAQIAIVAPALILVIAGFVVAYQFVGPPPPDRIVMATGSESGAYHAFGKLYAERFAKEGIELELKTTAGSRENLALLAGESSEVVVAFMQSGIGEPVELPDIRSPGQRLLRTLLGLCPRRRATPTAHRTGRSADRSRGRGQRYSRSCARAAGGQRSHRR